MSPKAAAIRKIIADAVGDDCGLGATLLIDFGPHGAILIDAISKPNRVSDRRSEADATVMVAMTTFENLMFGELDGTKALREGKIALRGDMNVIMAFGPVLLKARG